MKFIKAFILAAIPWFPIGSLIHDKTRNEDLAFGISAFISLIIFFVLMKVLKDDRSGTRIASGALGAVKDIKDKIELDLDQKTSHLLAQAEEEINTGTYDKGLWSQALIKAKGDENLRKVEYMKLRARQLKKSA